MKKYVKVVATKDPVALLTVDALIGSTLETTDEEGEDRFGPYIRVNLSREQFYAINGFYSREEKATTILYMEEFEWVNLSQQKTDI